MSKEKQIDEIAKLICNFPQCVNYNIIGECKARECQIADNAEKVYNAGYRKQSEGEWTYGVDREGTMKCTRCRRRMPKIDGARYCPNCGARMRGAKNE